MPPSDLHELLLSRMGVLGITKSTAAERLCMSRVTFAKKLDTPQLFTIAEIRELLSILKVPPATGRRFLL